MSSAPKRIALVIPVYEDWRSLEQLLRSIDNQPGLESVYFSILIVNDGSPTKPPMTEIGERGFRHIRSIKRLNLVCNLGSQRAIAVGLVTAASGIGTDGVVIMDSDGEDRPEDIPRLIATAKEHSGKIVCAQRSKRSEPVAFKSLYLLYKILFRILAGQLIDFGNFCYIPRGALDNLVYSTSLWNHLAATLVRSRLPLVRLSTERGRRYAGSSQMNLAALVAHGLTAISVYSDIVLVRIMFGVLGVAAIVMIGFVFVVAIRLFTELATPGWASTVIGALSIILVQSVIFALVSVFVLLSARITKPVIPITDAPQFIASIEQSEPGNLESALAP